MKKIQIFSTLLLLLAATGCAQPNISDKQDQIAAALLTTSEAQRDAATVYGYDEEDNYVLLRKGNNTTICVSDDPNRPGFQTVCYHKDLQPFMDRGRELRAEGKTPVEIFEIREEEAKSGILTMPENPATLHLLEGKEGRYDVELNQVVNANYRYVVYIPWATSESTGLPLKPIVPGAPWLMDPGTHRAHIMISTPPAPSGDSQ